MPAPKHVLPMTFFKEFREFATRGNVIDLAIGIIVGAAFTSIVTSLVTDIITPILGVLIGGIDFSNYFITLSRGASYPTLKAAQDAGAATLNYGLFLNAVIRFIIVSFAIFVLVKQINRLHRSAPPPPKADPQLEVLKEIRELLKTRPPV